MTVKGVKNDNVFNCGGALWVGVGCDDIANEHKDRIKSQKEFEREFQCEFKREPRKSRCGNK